LLSHHKKDIKRWFGGLLAVLFSIVFTRREVALDKNYPPLPLPIDLLFHHDAAAVYVLLSKFQFFRQLINYLIIYLFFWHDYWIFVDQAFSPSIKI